MKNSLSRKKTSMPQPKLFDRHYYWRSGSILVLLGFSTSSQAVRETCPMVDHSAAPTVTIGNVRPAANMTNGTVIATYQSTAFNDAGFFLPSSASQICSTLLWARITQLGYSITYRTGWPVTNYIAQTPIPGVGMRLSLQNGGSIAFANADKYVPTVLSRYSIHWPAGAWKVELIKTGPIGNGTIAAGTLLASVTGPTAESPVTWKTMLTLNLANSINVAPATCSMPTTAVSVPLGNIPDSRFTAVATTTGDRAFSLGLTCDQGGKVTLSLAGKQNADTTETSVLALTDAGQQGTATGVGVQLLYGDTPLKINSNLVLKTSAGGQETLAFTARYYQTQPKITAGKGNASATLTFTYQ